MKVWGALVTETIFLRAQADVKTTEGGATAWREGRPILSVWRAPEAVQPQASLHTLESSRPGTPRLKSRALPKVCKSKASDDHHPYTIVRYGRLFADVEPEVFRAHRVKMAYETATCYDERKYWTLRPETPPCPNPAPGCQQASLNIIHHLSSKHKAKGTSSGKKQTMNSREKDFHAPLWGNTQEKWLITWRP